jgi:hypothetical protein
MTEKKGRPISEMSVDTQILVRALLEAQEGTTITYDDLEKRIGQSVRTGAGRGYLSSARRHLLNHHQRWFACVRGEGVRWSGTDVVGEGDAAIRSLGRRSRTAAKKVATATYEKLSNEDRIRHNTSLAMLGAIGSMTRADRVKRLSSKVEQASDQLLPQQGVVEALFRKDGGSEKEDK